MANRGKRIDSFAAMLRFAQPGISIKMRQPRRQAPRIPPPSAGARRRASVAGELHIACLAAQIAALQASTEVPGMAPATMAQPRAQSTRIAGRRRQVGSSSCWPVHAFHRSNQGAAPPSSRCTGIVRRANFQDAIVNRTGGKPSFQRAAAVAQTLVGNRRRPRLHTRAAQLLKQVRRSCEEAASGRC